MRQALQALRPVFRVELYRGSADFKQERINAFAMPAAPLIQHSAKEHDSKLASFIAHFAALLRPSIRVTLAGLPISRPRSFSSAARFSSA